MQEEVEQKTIALSVRTARMTGEVLQRAMRKFLESQKHKTHEVPHGKQTRILNHVQTIMTTHVETIVLLYRAEC